MTDTIALIGIVNSGKSTIANSLVGKRLLDTGVLQTTTDKHIIENLTDDSNNRFNIIDLPGFSKENNQFDKLILKTIKMVDLIIWTHDSNNLISTYEINKFNEIKHILNENSIRTGKLYDIIIMLSKSHNSTNEPSNEPLNELLNEPPNELSNEPLNELSNEPLNELSNELSDSDDSILLYVYNDVRNKFSEEASNNNILLFNAFGRSYYNSNSSDNLKSFVKKMSFDITKNNIGFNIDKYFTNFEIRQKTHCEKMFNKFINYYYFGNNDDSYDKSYDEINNNIKLNYYSLVLNTIANIFDINNSNIKQFVRLYLDPDYNYLIKNNFGEISDWDVSNVTNMNNIFENATNFNQPLNNWNVSNVTNMSDMFQGCSSFNQPLDNWNVSKVTDMSFMFNKCSSFNQPLNNWNVSNVTNIIAMFQGANAFNQPLNNWNVSNVTNIIAMFQGANAFNQPLNIWNVYNVIDMSFMFCKCSSFNQIFITSAF
jgi:small GTP-binding protein